MKNWLAMKFVSARSKITSAKSKMTSFLKDETSAKGSTEEGYLTYAVIVIGIIVLGIVLGWLTNGFRDIGSFFSDGVNGNNTNPNGWRN